MISMACRAVVAAAASVCANFNTLSILWYFCRQIAVKLARGVLAVQTEYPAEPSDVVTAMKGGSLWLTLTVQRP